MTIGSLIREYRKKKGWFQKHLAEALGTSTQFISMLEKGQVKAPTMVIGQCLVYLEIPEEIVLKEVLREHELQLRSELEGGKRKALQNRDGKGAARAPSAG